MEISFPSLFAAIITSIYVFVGTIAIEKGVGSSGTAVVAGGVFNVFGDCLFVFPLKIGMAGAAVASVLGTAIQTLILISRFFLKKCMLCLAKKRGKTQTTISILKSCFSVGVVKFSFIILTVIMNKQILHYGGENVLAIFDAIIACSSLFQHFFL